LESRCSRQLSVSINYLGVCALGVTSWKHFALLTCISIRNIVRFARTLRRTPLELLLFQFAKARKPSCLILSKESGNVLLRVSYKWTIGHDGVSLGLSRV
jgi:hypothetical protein